MVLRAVLAILLVLMVTGVNLTPVDGQRKRYDGYRVIEITPTTEDQLRALKSLQYDDETLDFWLEPSSVGRQVHVMVSPTKFSSLKQKLLLGSMAFKTLVENVQENLDTEQSRLEERRARGKMAYDYNNFNDYATISEELATLNADCNSHPQLTCSLTTIGQSYEERNMEVIHISNGGTGKRAVWIDSTIHAREWLSTATVMNVLQRMIRDYSSDAVVRRWLDAYDFHFLPMMNPDGYVYTWNIDRLWRKSRNFNSGSACIGTDLNRNYPYLWATGGSSGTPCSDTYHGSRPSSELETLAVEMEGQRLAATLDVWLTFHTYGQYWLIPWGDCSLPPDYSEMLAVGNATVTAIQNTFGTTWLLGNSCELLYATSGSTADWAKGDHGVKYAYTPELRGDSHGFSPPPSYIQPSYEEIWNGLVAMFDTLATMQR